MSNGMMCIHNTTQGVYVVMEWHNAQLLHLLHSYSTECKKEKRVYYVINHGASLQEYFNNRPLQGVHSKHSSDAAFTNDRVDFDYHALHMLGWLPTWTLADHAIAFMSAPLCLSHPDRTTHPEFHHPPRTLPVNNCYLLLNHCSTPGLYTCEGCCLLQDSALSHCGQLHT